MGDNAHHDENGLMKVYPSPKPFGTTTCYTGSGDDPVLGIGKGNKILVRLANTDPEKFVDLVFNEDIYLKGGLVHCENAPFGAYMDVHIYNPDPFIEIATYARNVWLCGNERIYLNSNDRALLPAGIIVRISVHNSDDTDGISDPPAAFHMSGMLEVFRVNTV